MARRRILQSFRMMGHNEDIEIYRTARRVLDGKHVGMEEGMAINQPVELPADDGPVSSTYQEESSTAATVAS